MEEYHQLYWQGLKGEDFLHSNALMCITNIWTKSIMRYVFNARNLVYVYRCTRYYVCRWLRCPLLWNTHGRAWFWWKNTESQARVSAAQTAQAIQKGLVIWEWCTNGAHFASKSHNSLLPMNQVFSRLTKALACPLTMQSQLTTWVR